MISAVDLLKGIAVGASMKNIIVEGANGGLHTNYKGKADAAVKALVEDGYDFAYIHIEAPDEMGHQGSLEHKIQAIESIDRFVVDTVVKDFGSGRRRLSSFDPSGSSHPHPSKDSYSRSGAFLAL